jgi:hypothetical protein
MNISDDWHANPISSLYGNTLMLQARALCNFTTSNATLCDCGMWSYLMNPVVRSDSGQKITQQYYQQATFQKEEDLLKIAYAII